MFYKVLRTTTEKLQQDLAVLENEQNHFRILQWVGGRDWVLVYEDHREIPTVGAPEGWDPPSVSLDPPPVGETSIADKYVMGFYEDSPVGYAINKDGSKALLSESFSGYLEDTHQTWILYFDGKGRPLVYWPRRDVNGGVIGEPIHLIAT